MYNSRVSKTSLSPWVRGGGSNSRNSKHNQYHHLTMFSSLKSLFFAGELLLFILFKYSFTLHLDERITARLRRVATQSTAEELLILFICSARVFPAAYKRKLKLNPDDDAKIIRTYEITFGLKVRSINPFCTGFINFRTACDWLREEEKSVPSTLDNS